MKRNIKIVLSVIGCIFVLLIVIGFKLLPLLNYALAEKALEEGDKTKAIELFTRSCDGRNAESCNVLADMYYKGRVLSQNDSKACELYTKACTFGNIACEESQKMLDVQEKIKACDNGDIKSCRDVGFAYVSGEGVFTNVISADQYLTKACNGGDIPICKNLADTYVKGNLHSKAVKLYLKACDAGDFTSCGLLGSLYGSGGNGIQRDLGKFIEYMTKSCDGGIALSCGLLGNIYSDRNGDYIKANEYFTKACEGGDAKSCKQLGDTYSRGINVRQDDEKAFDAYSKACKFGNLCEENNRLVIKKEKTKACESGDAKSCRELGDIYYKGEGIERNYKKTFELYTKACNGNDSESCSKLGVMYRDDIGIEYNINNKEKAQQLFEMACNNGFSEGCNNLGLLYYRYLYNQDRYLKSIEPFKKACDSKNAIACENLSNMYYYLASDYERTDIKKAKELYGKSCDLQNQNGCRNYAILNKQ